MQQSETYAAGVFETLLFLGSRLWDKWRSPSLGDKQDGRPLAYFLPGQISLLVEHSSGLPSDLPPEEIIRLLRENPVIRASDSLIKALNTGQARVISFPATRGEGQSIRPRPAFSLVFVDTADLGASQRSLIRVIDDLNARIGPDGEGQGPLTVIVASPNWLSCCTPGQIGVGGPGARPAPPTPMKPGSTPWKFRLPQTLRLPEHRGAGVEVAIVDTAPCRHDLVRAYNDWHASNPLIDSLLGPNTPLDVTYAPYASLLSLADYGLKDHNYPMSDHGLFAAGIIHSIAPQAKLHLVEVLNQYGVGTIETIADGLRQLVDPARRAPLVINCSLMVNIPLPEQLPALAGTGLQWPRLDEALISRMGLLLEYVCNLLRSENVLVVAASGNDRRHTGDVIGSPPRARFPAAFESVLGVAALDPNQQPADYSNQADNPLAEGLATLGGAAVNGKADPVNGVLGLYSGQFPDPPRFNSSGWARWAGTSFAAPVISGTLAALLSQGRSADQATSDLNTAATTSSVVGKVFDVRQV